MCFKAADYLFPPPETLLKSAKLLLVLFFVAYLIVVILPIFAGPVNPFSRKKLKKDENGYCCLAKARL